MAPTGHQCRVPRLFLQTQPNKRGPVALGPIRAGNSILSASADPSQVVVVPESIAHTLANSIRVLPRSTGCCPIIEHSLPWQQITQWDPEYAANEYNLASYATLVLRSPPETFTCIHSHLKGMGYGPQRRAPLCGIICFAQQNSLHRSRCLGRVSKLHSNCSTVT